jgi:cobalt/nickel transport system permease protein
LDTWKASKVYSPPGGQGVDFLPRTCYFSYNRNTAITAPMHIPDGFLDTKTIVATSALAVVGVAVAWRRVRSEVPPQRVPLLGVAAAFVFAAQMLNFPVVGGTSGHIIGATLVAILLGPGTATIVLAAVLLVQCFLFADGGILALGANVFNMALLGVISGYALYRLLRRMLPGEWGNVTAVAIASWASVVVSSVLCAGELAWSGTVQWYMAFPAMAGIHALIGIGEAAITCVVLGAIKVARPDLLKPTTAAGEPRTAWDIVVYGIVAAIGLVLFVSPFASEWPDGLEMVASKVGFSQKALQTLSVPQPLADYSFPGLGAAAVSKIAAGTLGVAAVLLLVVVLARMLKSRS